MATIMSLKNVRNKPHRNGFDLSRRVCFSNKTGMLLPVDHFEVLPGDSIDINLKAFCRTIPLNTASYGRVREYYDVFFVPYSLLWDKWNSFIIQTNQPTHAASPTTGAYLGTTHPYFTLKQLYQAFPTAKHGSKDVGGNDYFSASWKLLHNLGYLNSASWVDHSSTATPIRLNPFPLLAYQKIYQDYFRYSQWEQSSPWVCNLDYMMSSNNRQLQMPDWTDTNQVKNNIFSMRYCNYDKDLFFGSIPTPQFGDEAMVSVNSSIISDLFSDRRNVYAGFDVNLLESETGDSPLKFNINDPNGEVNAIKGPNFPSRDRLRLNNFNVVPLTQNVTLSGLRSQFSVLAYRRAEASQKWKEITLSGDLDYRSQIQKHWGITPPKSESYMCTRLGGCARNLDVSEILNSNLSSTEDVAYIKGKGILSQDGHLRFKNTSAQYGLIMVLHHCKPLIEWSQTRVFDSTLTRVTADRYAIPEFDQIGNEPLYHYQFDSGSLLFGLPTAQQIAGYVPRYADYKTRFDIARGSFLNTNRNWILPYNGISDESSLPVELDYRAFKVASKSTDTMFVVASDDTDATDPYLCSLYIDVKVVRNLDRDGLPY